MNHSDNVLSANIFSVATNLYSSFSVKSFASFFALIFAVATNTLAQTHIDENADFINGVGSILIYYAEGWKVSPEAPERIIDGENLQKGISVQSLNIDSVKKAIGNQRYGWAELVFEVDSALSNKAWLLRNIGFGSIAVWVNGVKVFNDGEPSKEKENEQASRIKKTTSSPVFFRQGVNHLLVEYSWHKVPEWMYEMKISHHVYLRPIFSSSNSVGSAIRLELNRSFLFGTVGFVLLLLSIVHFYLSVKSQHTYHRYAFWTNVFLLLHVVSQMGDSTFEWTMSMFPVREFGHVILFPLVIYNIFFTFASYYKLTLPRKSLQVFFAVFILLSSLSVIYQAEVIQILHSSIMFLSIGLAIKLFRDAQKNGNKMRVSLMFSGLFVVFLGAFIYAVFYKIFYPQNMSIYFLSAIMVYLGVPISFSITIALDFGDIFEKMEQKVIERTKELSEKDEFKSRFFLNVSHELRTPTTILEGLLQKAFDQSSEKGEMKIPKEESSMILRNAKRLAILVNQILDLSKSDKGALSLQKDNHNLDELIQNVIVLNKSFISLRGQSVEFASNTQSISVNVDAEKISTILSNVLINASKYGPEYSRISVESRVNHAHDTIEIDIKDEGEGVAQSDRNVIFNRFHRIENTEKPYVEGLGIGLELSRSLARLHDGELAVVEDETRGARFRLSLPIEKTTALPQDQVLAEAPEFPNEIEHPSIQNKSPSEDKVHLLLVEDNPDMNAYVKSILSEIATVYPCKNGKEALSWLQQNSADIVVTDLMMPEMTGEMLIQRMAADPKLSLIPTIVLSAKDNADNRLDLLRVGIIDYVTKPFNPAELKLKIENLMRFYKRRQKYTVDLSGEQFAEMPSLSENVKNYILQNIDDTRLTTSDLADEFAMSERNFYRKIEKDSGMTPAAFIREVRLQYAAKLIETTPDIRLNELATKSGYKSIESFKRNYLERFGKSPK